MVDILDAPGLAPKYDKRLAIIVPYRDRAEHLGKFIPHMISYFERDKLDRNIAYSIHFVEQMGDEKFNRGKLLNSGFEIAKDDADYFCFHDVDYLPVWADYSYCDRPTHIIWHGLLPRYQYPGFIGGVVLFNKQDFVKVNGFSNDYWGWGEEDEELRERCFLVGLSVDRRDGTFTRLDHENAGFKPDGSRPAEGDTNKKKRLERAKRLGELYMQDGLNTLEYRLSDASKVSIGAQELDNVFYNKVEI